MMRGMAVPTIVWSRDTSSRHSITPAVASMSSRRGSFWDRGRAAVSTSDCTAFLQIVKSWLVFWQLSFQFGNHSQAEVPQLSQLLIGEAVEKVALKPDGLLPYGVYPVASLVCELGKDGAAIGGIGNARHQAVTLEVVDEARDVPRADVKPGCHQTERHALRLMPQHEQDPHACAAEAELIRPGVHRSVHQLGGEHQRAECLERRHCIGCDVSRHLLPNLYVVEKPILIGLNIEILHREYPHYE